MEGIILLGILVALFIYTANRYNKSQEKIKQHVRDGNILPEVIQSKPVIGDSILDITLRQRHFENTVYDNNNECAIAKALKELFPGSKPYVMTGSVEFNNGLERVWYRIFHEDTSTYQWEPGYMPDIFSTDNAFANQSINIGSNSKIRSIQLRKVV